MRAVKCLIHRYRRLKSCHDAALTVDEGRTLLRDGIARLRDETEDVVFLSFPGDEKASGGCIAAGRGFIHINSHGDAEPCPFSPYSDTHVRDAGLRAALASPLFKALQANGMMDDDHVGGCVLFEKHDAVEALLS